MLDGVGGLIDKADSLLGGGPAAAGTKGSPVFTKSGPLPSDGEPPEPLKLGLNAGGTDPNSASVWPPIEFIHFGHVHQDKPKLFRHELVPDASAKEKPKGRAIVFRNALEREAVLLQGYVTSCKAILQEYQSNRGTLGEVGQAVGKMFGSGASEPDPKELDTFKKNIAKAGGSVNKQEIKYPAIHQTGIDLHQARADYNEFAKKLGEHYLKPSSDPLGGAGAALTSLPGVGKIAGLIQGIIFKVFDIYLGMFLKVREEYEDDIAEASYQITLDSIRDKRMPAYPVWFPLPPAQPEQPNAGPAPPTDPVGKLLQPVTGAIDDAKKEVDGVKSDIQDFLGTGPSGPPAPGDARLDAAFKALAKSPDLIIEAFQTILDVGELPGFLKKVLNELAQCNLAMLKGVYVEILKKGAATPLDDQVLRSAGRKYLTHKIIDLLVDLTSLNFLKSEDKAVDLQGVGVSGKQVADKAASVLDEQVGKYAETILKFAIGQLGERLNDARALAVKQNGLTMEAFLGRLPWLLALMMRNTFFPIWDLIVDKVFGTIAGPLGQAASPVKNMLGEAKGVTGKVKDVKDRVKGATDQLAKGVNQNNVGSFVDNIVNGPGGNQAPADAATDLWPWQDEESPDKEPPKRLQPGEGIPVASSEIEEADKETAKLKFA